MSGGGGQTLVRKIGMSVRWGGDQILPRVGPSPLREKTLIKMNGWTAIRTNTVMDFACFDLQKSASVIVVDHKLDVPLNLTSQLIQG